jgi:hypothetical protein
MQVWGHANFRHWKDHLKNDRRSDQDHRQKLDRRSDQDQPFKNKTENHFSPYPCLRKKLAINCGRTAEELPDDQQHCSLSE